MPRFIGPGLLTLLTAVTLLASGGQALADHVQCGDVIKQDTTLDADLTDCPGDGIVIGADNVTLDMAGHLIHGSADRAGVGIANRDGHDGIAIANGRIQRFFNGVRLVNSSGSRIRRVSVSDSFYAIYLEGSNGNSIERNFATAGNPGAGVSLVDSDSNEIEANALADLDVGIDLYGSSANHIEGNAVSRAENTGMLISSYDGTPSVGNRVRHNAVTEYAYYGMYLGGSGHRIERNSIRGRGTLPHLPTIGIYALATDNVRVEQNRISFTERGIFCLDSPAANLIARNRVRSTHQGILSQGCNGIRITRNDMVDNGAAMIVVNCFGVTVDRNVARDNRHGITFQERVADSGIEHNVVLDSLEEGISVRGTRIGVLGNVVRGSGYRGIILNGDDADVSGNRVRGSGMDGIDLSGAGHRVAGNRAHRNGDDGIDVRSERTTITSNSANRNADLGIEAVAGSTDGGGNLAFGNGNPLQCVNVRCR